IERIAALPNVEVMPNVTVEALVGEPGALKGVKWRDRRSGETGTVPAGHLFSFIGAGPHTDRLAGALRPPRPPSLLVTSSARGGRAAERRGARRLRHRRRSRRIDQAALRRGGRGRPGRRGPARLPRQGARLSVDVRAPLAGSHVSQGRAPPTAVVEREWHER